VNASDPSEVEDRDSVLVEDGFIQAASFVCLPPLFSGTTIEESREALEYLRPAGPEMRSVARRDVIVWELASRTDNAVVVAMEKTSCSVHAVGARPQYSPDRLARILVENHGFDELENADQKEWYVKRTFWRAAENFVSSWKDFRATNTTAMSLSPISVATTDRNGPALDVAPISRVSDFRR
jgi:hypothetical protein